MNDDYALSGVNRVAKVNSADGVNVLCAVDEISEASQ